jgi:hypothetical protein
MRTVMNSLAASTLLLAAVYPGAARASVPVEEHHGVVIKLIATDVGLKFKLSADGVHVVLKS